MIYIYVIYIIYDNYFIAIGIWINNCVGHRNLPFFLRFLFYMTLLFTVGFIFLFLVVKGYIMFQDRYRDEPEFPVTDVTTTMVVFMVVNGIISIILYIFIVSMTLYQVIYLIRNVTRIERIQVSRIEKLIERGILEVSQDYPYNLGLFQNIEQVFGKKYWLWWLCSFPSGDGMDFPTNQPDNIAVHWPPPEFILYEKYPYRSKEFYKGVANGTIDPPPDILEDSQDSLRDYQNGPSNFDLNNLRKVNQYPRKNNNKIPSMNSSSSMTHPSSQANLQADDSDDSDNDALITILLRKKKEKQI